MNRLQKISLAILSGICFGLGWPETGSITPLLFVAFVPLLILQNDAKQNNSKLFGYSYLAFLTWHFISISWVYCVNEGIETKIISLLTPSLINSLFISTIFLWFHKARKRLGDKAGYVAFFSFWIAFEYLHLHWSLSYPWLNLGNGLANNIKWIQWYEFTGTFGGTLWILITNLIIYFIIREYIAFKTWHKLNIIGLALWLIVPCIISFVIWSNYEEKVDPIEVVIVQPNIDPYYEKFSGLTPEEQLVKFTQMGASKMTENTNYLIGPETAIPLSVNIDQFKQLPPWKILKGFQQEHPNLNITLGASLNKFFFPGDKITNTARKIRNQDVWYDSYNSAVQIDRSDTFQIYHKSKLVLGVETMPFPQFFQHFQDVIFDLGGTTGTLGTQKERDVFTSPTSSAVVAPVICWESVYGEYCNEYIQKGANTIFIMTNDGWWDDSPGYHQHFSYARLRAIETRRSIARSANTGTSALINQKGESFEETPWWEEAVIKGNINLNNDLTFYVTYGDYIARLGTFMAVMLLLWSIVKRFSKEELSLK